MPARRANEVHPAEAGLVIGNRDLEAGAVSVHGKGNLGAQKKDEAIAEILLSTKATRDLSAGSLLFDLRFPVAPR